MTTFVLDPSWFCDDNGDFTESFLEACENDALESEILKDDEEKNHE
jgi:hypothetical protein